MSKDKELEWEGAEEVKSNWFKFTSVGDGIKGTLTNKKFQKSTVEGYQDQWVYELLLADGSTSNVGISVVKQGTVDRLNKCQIGEIIGVKFESEGEKKPGKFAAKNLKVYTFGMDDKYLSGGLSSGSEPTSAPF